MTYVVSGPFPIKLGGVCQTSLVTNTTFLISLVSGRRVAPALTKGIMRDAGTFSIRSVPKPMFSKLRSVVVRMLFPNPCNGHRSMRATSGSTRQRDPSFPTRLSLNSARILGGEFFLFSKP